MFADSVYMTFLRATGVPPGVYSKGGALVVGRNTPFHIKGFAWFGMEEPGRVPRGLKKTSVDQVLKFAKHHNFNAIRLPLSVQNVLENQPTGAAISAFNNPKLTGWRYLDTLHTLVQQCAEHHILVLVDMHRLRNDMVQSSGLWYTTDYPEEKLAQAWDMVTDRLADEWNVLGADLVNEPWDSTWASPNDTLRDWKRAAEAIGNQIHAACPSWALFIEGVGKRAGQVTSNPFWAENLHPMQAAPPVVKLRNKVVLSPHVYGPAVYVQDYFKHDTFPNNMPAIWDDHFGKASNETGLATVVGEWGGTREGKDAKWQDKFYAYMQSRGIGFFYWCINPESTDTGGLLKDDWITPEHEKLKLLESAPSTSVEENIAHFQQRRTWRTFQGK